MPIAFLKVSVFAFIKTMAKMITAEEDPNAIVNIAPIEIERNMFEVYFRMVFLALTENILFKTIDNRMIEKINMAKPRTINGKIFSI